jgi:hypothetical protein
MTNGDAAKTAVAAPMSAEGRGIHFSEADPTKNVLDLVQAAIKRLDDLATERGNTLESKLQRVDDLRDSRIADLHELLILEREHIRQLADIRADYDKQLRIKETERIDAIRAVDVQAVQRAAEVSATQAQTLATQVQASAETLRTQVATTAVAQTTALAAALEPIQKDISELRKTQYELAGSKAQQIEYRQSSVQDKSSNQWVIGLVIGAIFTIIGFAITIAIVILR